MPETTLKELEYRLQLSDQERMRLKKRLMMGHSAQDRSSVLSMLDMMTLLLLFFIMMYVKSAMTEIQSVMKQETLPPQETPLPAPAAPMDMSVDIAKEVEMEAPSAEPVPVALPAEPPFDPSLTQLREEIADLMHQEGAQGSALRWDQKRLVFVLGERITFNIGQAHLLSDFEPVLSKIAHIIGSRAAYRILVSGHTDDRPINTPSFPSNWELSAARAIAVAKFLSGNGVDPERIVVQGFGEYQPLVPNSSTDNRQLNRRVEIRMVRQPPEADSPEGN